MKAVNESLKDTLGFDLTEVMRANTFEGKTTQNLNISASLPSNVASKTVDENGK